MSLYKLPIPEEELKTLVSDSVDYALSNGIIMTTREIFNGASVLSPFCLLPTEFSTSWFNYVKDMQPAINLLIHKVAHDEVFLKKTLERTIEGDEFTRRLFKIYEQVKQEGLGQEVSLGILRSDYMLNVDKSGVVSGIKQVEINTIASGSAALSTKLHGLHLHVLRKLGIRPDNSKFPATYGSIESAKGLLAAREIYGEPNAVILFVIEDELVNFSDQRMVEYEVLKADPSVSVIRRKLYEIYEQGSLKDRRFFINDLEVAVVFWRTGYIPAQYVSERDWETRLMLERSRAIKCPSINYHLAGTKKVQQELASPGVLERFVENPEEVERIRKVFGKQYSLDLTEAGDQAVEIALKNPELFVMKPQREGGGNNIYGKDIVPALEKLGRTKERESYILMELINAPVGKNYFIKYGEPAILKTIVSELGIYGVILGSAENVLLNFTAGHMVRSKPLGANETGIAAGYGALDMPLLC